MHIFYKMNPREIKMFGCLQGEVRNRGSRLHLIRDPMTIVWPIVAWNIAGDKLVDDPIDDLEVAPRFSAEHRGDTSGVSLAPPGHLENKYGRHLLMFELMLVGLPEDCFIEIISSYYAILMFQHPVRGEVHLRFTSHTGLWTIRVCDPGYTITSLSTRSVAELAAWYRRL